MDTFDELDDLLAAFGLHDAAGIPDQINTSITDDGPDDDGDNPEISLEARVDNYWTATQLTQQENVTQDGSPESDTDDPQSDIDNLEDIYYSGCGCSKNCFQQFTLCRIQENILSLREMEKNEKEMFIMGTLKKIGMDGRCKGERKRIRYEYIFEGIRVCQQSFFVIFDTKERTLKNITKHMREHGVEPRVHGHTGRRAPNAFSLDTIRDVVMYLLNFASEVGLPQPAPPRGRQEEPPVYLPSSYTKLSVHKDYVSTCAENDRAHVGLTTFKDVWLKCLPHIKISTPKDDVCRKCEEFRQEITLARSEENKLSATARYHDHIIHARKKRDLYRQCVEEATEMFSAANQGGGDRAYNNVHYTFDFSQYIKLPHHSREKGPTFFIQPRKIQMFGVRVDGFKQYNYLIDENEIIGEDGQLVHGPDSVISMLDHAFNTFGMGEADCRIHADNCYGQNKNRYVLAYLSWRTIPQRHRSITYMMQLPGHTRCLIDAGFGSIKKLYRRSDCDTKQHIVDIVSKSSHSNVPVVYSDGWTWRTWKSFFLERFKKVPNISKHHHFRFTADEPGVVFMKIAADETTETRFVICKPQLLPMASDDLPPTISAAGLSHQRQTYLFRHVRPLVRRQFQEILCPALDPR